MKESFALLDELLKAKLDYFHIAITNAWAKPRRGVTSERSRAELIIEYVDGRVPVIGVGNVHTAEDASLVSDKGKKISQDLGGPLLLTRIG